MNKINPNRMSNLKTFSNTLRMLATEVDSIAENTPLEDQSREIKTLFNKYGIA